MEKYLFYRWELRKYLYGYEHVFVPWYDFEFCVVQEVWLTIPEYIKALKVEETLTGIWNHYGNKLHKKKKDAEWSAEVIDDDIKDSIHDFLIS